MSGASVDSGFSWRLSFLLLRGNCSAEHRQSRGNFTRVRRPSSRGRIDSSYGEYRIPPDRSHRSPRRLLPDTSVREISTLGRRGGRYSVGRPDMSSSSGIDREQSAPWKPHSPMPDHWSGDMQARRYPEAFSLQSLLLNREPSAVTHPLDFTGLGDNRLPVVSMPGHSPGPIRNTSFTASTQRIPTSQVFLHWPRTYSRWTPSSRVARLPSPRRPPMQRRWACTSPSHGNPGTARFRQSMAAISSPGPTFRPFPNGAWCNSPAFSIGSRAIMPNSAVRSGNGLTCMPPGAGSGRRRPSRSGPLERIDAAACSMATLGAASGPRPTTGSTRYIAVRASISRTAVCPRAWRR